jgi:hypothetical protein
MQRSLAVISLAVLVSTASCEFAVKHPAITVGIVGGVVAAGSCELGTGGEHATCGIVTGSVAVGLAGIVWLAMLLGGEGNTVLQGPDPDDPPPPQVPQDPTLDKPVKTPAPTTPAP